MSLPLHFEPGVREEIDEAYAFYEGRRVGLGEEFLAEVEVALDWILQNPAAHALVYKAVRLVLVKRFPYAVYYRSGSDRVEVVSIHHTSRDPRRWQSRA